MMVPGQVYRARQAVVQVREGHSIFGAHWCAHNELGDIVELVPVVVDVVNVLVQWFVLLDE